jgi:hypothetical protein
MPRISDFPLERLHEPELRGYLEHAARNSPVRALPRRGR